MNKIGGPLELIDTSDVIAQSESDQHSPPIAPLSHVEPWRQPFGIAYGAYPLAGWLAALRFIPAKGHPPHALPWIAARMTVSQCADRARSVRSSPRY